MVNRKKIEINNSKHIIYNYILKFKKLTKPTWKNVQTNDELGDTGLKK